MNKRRTLSEIYKDLSHDPARDQVNQLVMTSSLTVKAIANKSGVSETTLRNWLKKITKKPQKITMDFVLRSIGHEFKIVPKTHR